MEESASWAAGTTAHNNLQLFPEGDLIWF